MGCWHDHGSWCGWAPPRGWYGPPVDDRGWFDEPYGPVAHRLCTRTPGYRREPPIDRESTVLSLEARLDELRDELQRVEAALAEVRRPAGDASEQR